MRLSKKILIFLLFPILFCCTNYLNIFASSNYVYLGGDSIGIRLDTGVIITGKFEVNTYDGKVKPWKKSNIEIGDQITAFNHQVVKNNQSLLNYLRRTTNEEVVLTILRNNKEFDTKINIVDTINDERSLGLYVKDQLMGVGTLTYVDPLNNYFASLGHGVYSDNIDTGKVSGALVYSTVEAIKKGFPGSPGEKRAILDNTILGVLNYNDISGVYGIINEKYHPNIKMEIAKPTEVKRGKAKIYTVIKHNEIECYDILITEYNQQDKKDNKGLKIKITDQRLIKETGGIVQGMSGSPIVQNGKIIGAVSHVSVNNPLVGYGVYAYWMKQEIDNLVRES